MCNCVFSFFLQSVITLNVKNTGTETVYFTYYTPLLWLKCLSLVDEQKVTKAKPLSLKPGDANVASELSRLAPPFQI